MAKLSQRYLTLFALLVAWFGLVPGAVYAQNGAASAASKVRFEFTVFAAERLAGLYYLPSPDEKPQELVFASQSKSKLYSYHGSRELVFFRLSVKPGAESGTVAGNAIIEPAAVPVARLVIPEKAERAMLLFLTEPRPGEGAGASFRIYSVNDSYATLASGQVLILNASGRDYAAELAGQQAFLGAGLSGPYTVGSHLVLKLGAQTGSNWVKAGVREVNLGASARAIVVLFPPTVKGGIAPNIRILADDVPPPKPATP